MGNFWIKEPVSSFCCKQDKSHVQQSKFRAVLPRLSKRVCSVWYDASSFCLWYRVSFKMMENFVKSIHDKLVEVVGKPTEEAIPVLFPLSLIKRGARPSDHRSPLLSVSVMGWKLVIKYRLLLCIRSGRCPATFARNVSWRVTNS